MSDTIITYAIPFFLLLILAEVIYSNLHDLDLYHGKDTFASLVMGLGSVLISIGVKFIAFAGFSFLYQFALFDIGYQWWAWLILIFADDFTFYVHHRASHSVRLLWAAHVNHHSSKRMNLGTALRQSWTELFYKYVWWIWLPLLGFPPIMVLTMISINLIYQFWIHTETIGKLGPIEWLFNTPSHHRVHHATNIKYLDRNHAGMFIIWDRLFGTFVEEDENEQPDYGIRGPHPTYNPFHIATHAFIDLWRDIRQPNPLWVKLRYIFMPPGWSPDGSTLTTNQLREGVNKGLISADA
ncbi:MAG: C-5 sterol desaturase [Bacteroidetes bacterium SW_11_45_7]|nr:MAG: C-5 sterol desaturase [Bacteroidetes bacterium SW_11_45_7]